jgi:hypothetical protein
MAVLLLERWLVYFLKSQWRRLVKGVNVGFLFKPKSDISCVIIVMLCCVSAAVYYYHWHQFAG